MEKIGKIVLIFSLLGICILYGISIIVKPLSISLEEVEAHEGNIVKIKGVITDFRITKSENLLLKIKEGKKEVQIFVKSFNEEDKGIEYGDEIEVTGKVRLYEGSYEIVVASAEAIKKIKNSEGSIFFVSQIAKSPEEYEGMRINVVGYVSAVYKNVFYLSDEIGEYRMRVMVTPNISADITSLPISELHTDDKIIAQGMFLYDPKQMRYQLKLLYFKPCE